MRDSGGEGRPGAECNSSPRAHLPLHSCHEPLPSHGRTRTPRRDAAGPGRPLAALARTASDGSRPHIGAHVVERRRERPLDGPHRGPRRVLAGDLGRSALPDDRGRDRRGTRRGAAGRGRGRGPAPARHGADRADVRGLVPRSPERRGALEARRDDRDPARGLPPLVRELRLGLARHRWRARARLVRLPGDLHLRPQRRAALEAGPRRPARDAQLLRRGPRTRPGRRRPDPGLRSGG